MDHVHVFLGPSLDLTTANALLPQAYYHPPIQCGDIIRLLRLNPKLIVIIDGLYETTPAVWHKEILLAIEAGVDVWGAASMGALRAAELYHYGMYGFGDIFLDYKEGMLTDDDEVAVLHLGGDKQFAAINDAMVNIRATCEKAWKENIITLKTKNELLNYCKKQFYPYRSLAKAIQFLSKSSAIEYAGIAEWLNIDGVIDVKKNDTIATLKHINMLLSTASGPSKPASNELKSMTCFLRDLIIFANATSFRHTANWLPDIEKQLYSLHQQSPKEYMLLAEVTSFLQKLIVFSSSDKRAINNDALINYIQKNQLYSPEKDFIVFKEHPVLSEIYSLICQSICLLNLTLDQLNEYLPALAHYYDLPPELATPSNRVLRIILVLILAINQQMKPRELLLSKKYFQHHLKQVRGWRRYTHLQFKSWLHNSPMNFMNLLNAYLMAFSVHALSEVKVEYYRWIYDVHRMLYEDGN